MYNEGFTAKDLEGFITRWNIDFPIDYWWRQTHGVSFNSKSHRETSFIDMLIEWEERQVMRDLTINKEEEVYIPNSGNWYSSSIASQEISEEDFNKVDIDKI